MIQSSTVLVLYWTCVAPVLGVRIAGVFMLGRITFFSCKYYYITWSKYKNRKGENRDSVVCLPETKAKLIWFSV